MITTPSVAYVIDSSALIDLKEHYPEDTFPSLWERLEELASNGRLKCPREVLREIEKKNENLHDWLKNNAAVISDAETAKLAPVAAQIDSSYPELKKGRHSKFPKPRSADPWVVALASQKKGIVISTERPRPNAQKITQIPDVCRNESIRCLNLTEWFRELGLVFVIR